MKKLIFSLLMASIIFTVGCENATESTPTQYRMRMKQKNVCNK